MSCLSAGKRGRTDNASSSTFLQLTPIPRSAGIVDKAVPLDVSDPVLLGYLRRAMSTWAFRPAQANGAAVDSWNELVLSGQVAYDVELKQIASLRRTLAGT